jgi:hypothetical protein
MSDPCPEPSKREHDPMEDAFTEDEMRLAGIYCRALTGGPTDFDREVQEHLDRLERLRDEGRLRPP